MNNSRIKNIVNLSAAERYGYFIRKVSDFEEVWGLKDKEGWALMGNNEQVLFPVWSEKEFAELCKWDNYQPNSIPLDDFIEKLLPKLEKDNVMLAVFPLSKGKGIIRTVQEMYLQPIITQYFIDNKSEIWLLFLIAHSKR